MLWLRTALFTLLIPGTELVLVPYLLVRHFGHQFDAGIIRRGRGTPAPYDPPRRLVVAGLYRYVRNPQYIAVVLVAASEALFFGSLILFGYAAFFAIGYHFFVRLYEEPTLTRSFGADYIRYCEAVPRWLPKLSPAVTP